MHHIFNIVKKELAKIFRSPRLIFSTFILSPLLIFCIYSLMGNVMSNEADNIEKNLSNIGVINVEEFNQTTKEKSFYQAIKNYNQTYAAANNITLEDEYTLSLLNIKLIHYPNAVTLEDFNNKESDVHKDLTQKIENNEVDIWIYYDQDFDEKTDGLPNIVTMYKSSQNKATVALNKAMTIVNGQSTIFLNEKYPGGIDVIKQETLDLATDEEVSNTVLGMLVPMLIIIFIFAGGMSIGADLIAGEKERGTISTLLMTPVSKDKIIIGKIIAGIILVTISSICSAIGMVASVGNLMQFGGGISLNIIQILQLLLIIFLIALFAIALFMVASTFAKNVKEATMFIMPFYILAMIVSMVPSFSANASTQFYYYLIPIYNVSLAMKGIFLGSLTGMHLILIIVSTIVYVALLLLLTTWLFKQERVMFSK